MTSNLFTAVDEGISAMLLFRSGWANNIRKGGEFGTPEAKEVLYELYSISGCILLALQQLDKGIYRDKLAMTMVRKQLERLVKSDAFDKLSAMSDIGMCQVITNGTKHHIRVMFEYLDYLQA